MNANSIPGLLLPSILLDRCLGPLNTLILQVLLAALLAFLLLGCQSFAALMLAACAYGFFTGGVQGLFIAAVESFVPRKGLLGVRMAMVLMVIGVAGLTGPPIGGLMVGGRAGWKGAMGFSGSALVMGGGLLVVARWWAGGGGGGNG